MEERVPDMNVVIAKLEWIEARQQERHLENSARLMRIESEVRATNGRVSRHDQEILALKLAQERGERDDASAKELKDLEDAPMSLKSIKAIVGYIAAALGALWFVMTQVLGYTRAGH